MKPSAAEIERVLKTLKTRWKNPGAMHLEDPYRTVVGVALSARTRDEQVLKLLPAFFDRFPSPKELAETSEAEIRQYIDTIGMYKQKARNLKKLGTQLVRDFGGKVPCTMEELVTLAGVGRKTASVLMTACFNSPAIAVDTHVHRVTNRLGWVKATTPPKTEEQLLKAVPKDLQPLVNQVFVKHGRYVCLPTPRCWMCPVRDLCAYKKKNVTPPKDADAIMADIERREDALESSRRALL